MLRHGEALYKAYPVSYNMSEMTIRTYMTNTIEASEAAESHVGVYTL